LVPHTLALIEGLADAASGWTAQHLPPN
jgi:hypothetical protein